MSKKKRAEKPEPYEDYQQITVDDIRAALAAVEFGHDQMAAGNLIRYFSEAMQRDELFQGYVKTGSREQLFLKFISMAFERYCLGDSVEAAFGLTRKRGDRGREDTTERNVKIAAAVILGMRGKKTWADAIGDAANQFFPDGAGQRACEDAYAEYRDLLSAMPDTALGSLARSNTDDLTA